MFDLYNLIPCLDTISIRHPNMNCRLLIIGLCWKSYVSSVFSFFFFFCKKGNYLSMYVRKANNFRCFIQSKSWIDRTSCGNFRQCLVDTTNFNLTSPFKEKEKLAGHLILSNFPTNLFSQTNIFFPN